MFDPDEWLEIGKIVAPQGLQGEIRVYPSSDFPERFLEPGERWLLRPGGDRPESVQLAGGRFLSSKGLYIIQLDGITGREQVDALRNSKLMVLASDRPSLEAGEYHVSDLVGLEVYHQVTEQQIGVVRDILTAGNDLLEVELLPKMTEPDSQSDAVEVANSAAPQADAPVEQSQADGGELAVEGANLSGTAANSSMRRSKAKRAAKNAAKRAAKKENKGVQRVLIPFVKEIVPVVDLERRRIEVLPPPGLIDVD